MTHRDARPHQESLADAGTGILAVGFFLAGFAIGVSGPLFVVIVSPAFVAGPTWGGLALFGAILVGGLSGPIVLIALGLGRRPYVGVAIFAGCASLAVGTFVGGWLGSSAGLGGWAIARETPARPYVWQGTAASFPTYFEAHADVSLRLDAPPGFTSKPTTDGPDGTFGHWCRSGPDSAVVAEVSAMDVASIGTSTIYADLYLADPSPIGLGSSIGYPRLVLQLREPSGFTQFLWGGPVRIVADHGTSGTVTFDALVADPAPPGLPRTLSGQLAWTCRAWSKP